MLKIQLAWKSLVSIVSLLTLTMLIGCGQTAPKAVPPKSANAVGVADAKCSSTSACPSIKLIIDATGLQGSALVGNVNERAAWTFTGRTETAAAREILIYLMYEPQGSSIRGQGSTSVEVVWTATSAMNSSTPIKALARDVTRCKMFEGSNAKACSDMRKKLPKYEVEESFNYQIVESTSDLIDPGFTSNKPPQGGANSGLGGCVTGALPGILAGMAGGGGMMQGAMGCVTGMIGIGSNNTSTTTQSPLGGLLGGGTP